MKNIKGFAGIGLIIAILAILVIGGGVVYYKAKNSTVIINQKKENPTDVIPDKKVVNYIKVDNNNAVVLANNAFAFDIYSKLAKKGENMFFSPFSVSSAFAMVYEGANGKTADEIQSVFHFPKDINILRDSFSSINNEINTANQDYQLNIANAIWVQKDFAFLADYLSNVGTYYSAKATNVDFKNATEEARQTINKWVEDKTNDKIKDILLPGILNSSTKLALTDAIYFNGKWIKPFDRKGTKETDFSLYPNGSVKINMMEQKDDKAVFNYAENNDLQILEMPYKGNELSMIIILPKKNDLISFEKLFTLSNLNNWKKDLKNQRVNVFIPQFKFDTNYDMVDTLTSMGMPTAFTVNADFSKMDGQKDLSIGAVIHKAFIDVNEDGTEAAAATVVAMTAGSALQQGPRIPEFYANHPFLFVIEDSTNGNILFMGNVVNPSK
ncbi:MAG TPA: serpin family protein [Candidatus Paceibacterota bacterium]|jgi:serpin B|nr:serpin family protein [Candidatus Paceibacterota bacterium]